MNPEQTPMLACGCAAQATRNGAPWCSTHGEGRLAIPPDLAGRTARCAYSCGHTQPSSLRLAFFRHLPERDTDQYYCGCFGWD